MSREKKVTPMKLAAGSIRRRGKNGCFAYRCQVNGRRTEISLQTKDYQEALKKVASLVPITLAKSAEVIAAHVNVARGFAKQSEDLALSDALERYEQHPDRAMPQQTITAATASNIKNFATDNTGMKAPRQRARIIWQKNRVLRRFLTGIEGKKRKI